MKRRQLLAAGAAAAGAAGLARVQGKTPTSNDAPGTSRTNILFLMTDQQFGDAMSCRMGRTWLHTPAMDSLAETGTVFSRAYSPNPLCMPARGSIFTGRFPHQTRVTRNAHVKLDPEKLPCMGTYFRHAGYETMYIGKWHLCYPPKKTDSHGFQTTQCLRNNGHDGEIGDLGAAYLAGKKGKPGKPFLAVVSLSNPHDVCQLGRREKLPSGPIGSPPAPGKCPPVPANLEPPAGETDTMTLLRKGYHAHRLFPVGDYTKDDWRQYRWGYYRLVEKVDREIGKVLAALREAGLEDNTAVVFVSDHGECAGAHRFNQKTVFYEESVRVPLIVSHKGRTRKGTCDKLVNTGIDILPTLCDLAGIPRPAGLTGRSLAPLARGEQPRQWRDHVVSENHMTQTGEVNGKRPTAQGRMVRSQRYKYCVYDSGTQRESLVDLQADPGEMRNLAADPAHRKTLQAHRKLLQDFAARHHDNLAAAMLQRVESP